MKLTIYSGTNWHSKLNRGHPAPHGQLAAQSRLRDRRLHHYPCQLRSSCDPERREQRCGDVKIWKFENLKMRWMLDIYSVGKFRENIAGRWHSVALWRRGGSRGRNRGFIPGGNKFGMLSSTTSSSAMVSELFNSISFNFFQSHSISFNLFQSAPWDCSENTAKEEALGHRERQSDRRKLLSATMSPIATDCGVVAESPTGEA